MRCLSRTKASLVSARDQHPSLLGRGALGRHMAVQDVPPVLQGNNVHLHLANLCLGGPDGVRLARVRDIGPELVEVVLELCLVFRNLLRAGQERQSGSDGGREAHLDKKSMYRELRD